MQLKHDEIWLKHDFSFDCVCYSFLSIPWGFIQADETWSVFDIKDWVSLISMVCYYSRVVFSYWKSQINPNVRCFILLIDLWVFLSYEQVEGAKLPLCQDSIRNLKFGTKIEGHHFKKYGHCSKSPTDLPVSVLFSEKTDFLSFYNGKGLYCQSNGRQVHCIVFCRNPASRVLQNTIKNRKISMAPHLVFVKSHIVLIFQI